MYEKTLKALIFFLLLAEPNTCITKAENANMIYDINYNDLSEDLNLDKRTPSIYFIRRSCVPRGGNCDLRPHDCCHSSSCRCNLWGSNCRCQRVGLFQKWG
ncbi:U8-agatoxin-Ao1a-like [Condylostylus longicornis]|uniref:U8-agatoxin-Ao1a-like n=1 Tax=Condylostylus longicornis TaxID=2530218 RepID=UPI00244DB895|nr:U8-agatoxin-Ao1a-like [Condylostylus longicornis]